MARKPVKSSVSVRGGVTCIFSAQYQRMRSAAAIALLALALSARAEFSAEEKARLLAHGPWPPAPQRDATNRVSGKSAAVALGERLFDEPRLSGTGSILCASCHEPF